MELTELYQKGEEVLRRIMTMVGSRDPGQVGCHVLISDHDS